MCHKKLSIELCNNVNFIHGQNGSGKSAILAALQICLGAGANRTHRARNLKDLVRKEGGATHSKVRVTLLNRGADAFQHEVYGDLIHIERNIYLRGSGGGYKLYAEDMTCKSEKKKDLQALLDQMNIQVENPVAVLDQEEAKKFLTGKPEDKYAFFMKATDLERMDRKYIESTESIYELEEALLKMRNQLAPLSETVKKLHAEWKEFQKLEKLEHKISKYSVDYAWSFYAKCKNELDGEIQALEIAQANADRFEKKLEKQMGQTFDAAEEEELNKRLQDLTAEAGEANNIRRELYQELKEANLPKKKIEVALKNMRRQIQQAKDMFTHATKELQVKRKEILDHQGSAGAEEAKRTERTTRAESAKEEAKRIIEESKRSAKEYLDKYDGSKRNVQSLEEQVNDIRRQRGAIVNKINELQSKGDHSLTLFGRKCEDMYRKVTQAQRDGKFRGKVIGPIGKYLKIAPGKDRYAAVAEKALQVGLDRFIVTNKQDRSLYLKMRQEVGCNDRDCGVSQMSEGPRYNVRRPPEGVETVATIFTVSDDLVYNFLVDNGSIDQKAVCDSMDASNEALEIQEGSRTSIRGGNIRMVYCLPQGDYWQIFQGNKSITSSDGRFKNVVGVDTTQAIRQAQGERAEVEQELDQKSRRLVELKRERQEYKVQWNNFTKADKAAFRKINELNEELEQIREEAEAAENVTVDTTAFEDDVTKAGEEYDKMKSAREDMEREIEELLPGIAAIQKQIEEVNARNETVKGELAEAEEKLSEFMRSKAKKERDLQKKKDKLREAKQSLEQHAQLVAEKQQATDETLLKSRLLYLRTETQKKKSEGLQQRAEGNDDGHELTSEVEYTEEEIAAVEPVSDISREPEYFQNKIRRTRNDIVRERERRQLTETNPEAALEKYTRAQHALNTKIYQIEKVEDNMNLLTLDIRERKKLWKLFREHIVEMSNGTFDEVLNRKGSSGSIDFNHKHGTLDLVVQKDNMDENSQTSDVKALSGGERSFTTLALLLALGESLETPFRVMDEFDVFLDPVARKIALNTMIEIAKEFEHRQFIFITPQDLSNIKTDSKVKILKMKAPERNALVGGHVQQTIDM